MQEVSMQHMMIFVGSIIDFLARELTQSAFWYQVLAIVVAVLLSYFVARVCSQKWLLGKKTSPKKRSVTNFADFP